MPRLTDLSPDSRNPNKGTERGRAILEDSVRRAGLGRSILTDAEGNIIAGNKTAEVAVDLGLEDAIVVPSDGSALVAVRRTDLDLSEGGLARELSILDNRAAELSLEWDTAALASAPDASRYFEANEWQRLMAEPATRAAAAPELPVSDVRLVQLFLNDEQKERFDTAVETLRARLGTESVSATVIHAVLNESAN